MTRLVIFLPTELSPTQCMLKRSIHLSALQDTYSEDMYLATRFKTYLVKSPQLADVLYEEYYQWWRPAASTEQKTAKRKAADVDSHSIRFRRKDDFQAFQCATHVLDDARLQLERRIEDCDVAINTNNQLLALLRSVAYLGVSGADVDALCAYYEKQGLEPPSKHLHTVFC